MIFSKIKCLLHFLNLYFTDISTHTKKKRFPMFSLTNLNVFCKEKQIQNLMPAMHSKNVLQKHVYPCVASPFLLITLFNQSSGTEDTNCCSFASGIFAYSCPVQDFNHLCSHCLILLLMMCRTISTEDRSGLLACHSSTCTSVFMQPRYCTTCRNKPGTDLLKSPWTS